MEATKVAPSAFSAFKSAVSIPSDLIPKSSEQTAEKSETLKNDNVEKKTIKGKAKFVPKPPPGPPPPFAFVKKD